MSASRQLLAIIGTCASLLAVLACGGKDSGGADTLPVATRLERACGEVARTFRALPSGRVEQAMGSFAAFVGTARREGCVVRAYGPLREPVTVAHLRGAIPDSLGALWRPEPDIAADGPNGTVYGLWRDDVLCIFRIDWNTVEGADPRLGQEPQYVAEVGCERLPDRTVPRG